MAQILRRVAVSGLGLTLAAFFAFAGTASAQSEVTVGGVVEVIGGTSDHDDGFDGLDRGLFSRITVGYGNTLDNGLEVNANIAYLLNAGRGSTSQDRQGDVDYAPDVLYLSVGGGFGTITAGHHAMADCAMMPRPIAFVPGGVNATWYRHFSGLWGSLSNVTFSSSNYCGTPTGLSYSTPSMGGFSAMVSYAPNMEADQVMSLANAGDNEDYMAVAGTFKSAMGGMDLHLGASYQTGSDDYMDALGVAGTIGMGGATLGMSYYDNGDRSNGAYRAGTSGWNIAAKYALGALTPAITYSSMELEDGGDMMPAVDETALVLGVNYAVGGGLSVFAEYMSLEVQEAGAAASDETMLMSGAIVSF